MTRNWQLLGAFAVLFFVAPAFAKAPVPKDAGANRPTTGEVQVIGVYEGQYPPGVKHAAGFHPPGEVLVKVGAVKKPVILVLTSYEPVNWKIEAPKGVVARVIASGYHAQVVEGVDKNVPVKLISYKAGDKDYFYAYKLNAGPNATEREQQQTAKKYDNLVARVKELTKQDVKGFQGAYAGDTFEIK